MRAVEVKELERLRRAYEAEIRVKALLKRLLDAPAYERMARIRLSSPELYTTLLQLITSLYEGGKLTARISEEQLLNWAGAILAQRRETRIKRI